VDGQIDVSVTAWLSAMVGVPHLFMNALRALGSLGPHTLTRLDANDGPVSAHTFFRASASLVLPRTGIERVGVGALVLRPDGHSTQLAIGGVFEWPTQHAEALRAVERLIQAYVDQWLPERALWAAPAETLLAGEIG
jgi:hypothetical protein